MNALKQDNPSRLLDEIEQLRASLESALEENSKLVEDRDRLRTRTRELSRELRETYRALADHEERATIVEPALVRHGETEEELRVALEELQVLTEELESANTGLQRSNEELDARVEERSQQLREIDKALRATEASLRVVADLVPELVWRADALGEADWFNERWLSYTGADADRALGLAWLDFVHPDDRTATQASWAEAIESGASFENEHRLRAASGDYRWFLVRAEPLRDDLQRIIRWFVAGTDVQDHRRTIEALQHSESRFRTLVEGVPQLIWRSRDLGEWTWSSSQWSRFTGQSEKEAAGLGWLEAFHPSDREAAVAAWSRAEEQGVLEIEGRIFDVVDSRFRQFRTLALPLRGADGGVVEWLGTSTNVDDLFQLRKQQDVLVTELQHRTRNLMGVVQAVTARTLRGVSSLDEFAKCIDDRLSALARVQGLLSRRDTGTRVAFDLLLREELSAHVALDAEGGERVQLEGPPGVRLRSANVQAFALALHELATNAVKYGALSVETGRLHIRWGVHDDIMRGKRLWVDWRETGIDDIAETAGSAHGGGYGRELIERALPYQLGAQTTYGFEADGVHCTIEVPLSAPQDSREMING